MASFVTRSKAVAVLWQLRCAYTDLEDTIFVNSKIICLIENCMFSKLRYMRQIQLTGLRFPKQCKCLVSIFDILSNGRTSATFHSAGKDKNLTTCSSSLSVQEEEHLDIARQSKSALDPMN